jgi:TPP-dependent pyruvate/acetoin dehydrogenase alpha subunit
MTFKEFISALTIASVFALPWILYFANMQPN